MNTFTYVIQKNLYINLTNRCTNRCAFCVRDQSAQYEGYSLFLEREPAAEEVIGEIGDPTRFEEVVFCGYGEPTCRLKEMLIVADYVKSRGGKTRLNTNGHGSLIWGYDVAPALKGYIDGINISLNASTREGYEKLCRPQIAGAFEGLLSFARSCKREGLNAWFSVVDCIGREEVERCRLLAKEVGLPLRVREMIDNRNK